MKAVKFHPDAEDVMILVIMAVMHLHREPDYWKNRQDSNNLL